ncbi:predicted protein [Plenodomus lingam JN3]|uniref:Predicted protein n=1 Tax=Leptosphaeria maculans (strain JN3 / isolate v23.1.3 / race Av1-4-5-6-7-8) TaxID=985895 RepID=E4ZK38_LEPMJ|nr:predicted protein [Plenodomus lingam JN3]CBX91633.1 predicted protein [Plenodomus lingam JN3]
MNAPGAASASASPPDSHQRWLAKINHLQYLSSKKRQPIAVWNEAGVQ